MRDGGVLEWFRVVEFRNGGGLLVGGGGLDVEGV